MSQPTSHGTPMSLLLLLPCFLPLMISCAVSTSSSPLHAVPAGLPGRRGREGALRAGSPAGAGRAVRDGLLPRCGRCAAAAGPGTLLSGQGLGFCFGAIRPCAVLASTDNLCMMGRCGFTSKGPLDRSAHVLVKCKHCPASAGRAPVLPLSPFVYPVHLAHPCCRQCASV